MQTQAPLDPMIFSKIVEFAPLISIDLVVENDVGETLLGCRNNPPAQEMWFVPGGRVYKGERLGEALTRLFRDELAIQDHSIQPRFLGVYEHIYDENVFGDPGFGTHYVVLAHRLMLDLQIDDLPLEQHGSYRWWSKSELLRSKDVHAYTKAYFQGDEV
jgi:colanic acid biosynthesis protein WcaH